jgi:hypothetical protein
MTEKFKAFAFEAWAEIAETTAGAAIYARQDSERLLGVTAYLMTAFVTGNVISAVWNIYLRAGAIA